MFLGAFQKVSEVVIVFMNSNVNVLGIWSKGNVLLQEVYLWTFRGGGLIKDDIIVQKALVFVLLITRIFKSGISYFGKIKILNIRTRIWEVYWTKVWEGVQSLIKGMVDFYIYFLTFKVRLIWQTH